MQWLEMLAAAVHSLYEMAWGVAISRDSGSLAPTAHEAALGALLGACVGDAAGVTLEFTSSDLIKRAAVAHALTLPGGGVFRVGPGQVSDDTELAQCLALGLTRGQPPIFPAEAVARCYADWYSTGPFDIGQATRNAASAAARAVAEGRPAAEAMWQGAAQHNGGSKANGALMRAVPLALWGCRLEPEQLAAACSQDTRLSHPNQSCQDATAAYCIAIAWLINHSGDARGAVTAAEGWASQNANGEVQGWLREAAEPGDGPSCLHMIGFVHWGFVHAFRHLRLRSPFKAALADMLRRGGDVDTNACIVCGAMGALHGAGSIPPAMADAVLGCRWRQDCSSLGQPRPEFLLPKQVPELVKQLCFSKLSLQV